MIDKNTLQAWREGTIDDIRDQCGCEGFLRLNPPPPPCLRALPRIVKSSSGFCVNEEDARKILQKLLPMMHDCVKNKNEIIIRGREMPINHVQGFTVGAITKKGNVVVHNNGFFAEYNNNGCTQVFQYKEILLLAEKLGVS